MNNIKKIVNEEIHRLEKDLKTIDTFLESAPKGCLKWQNKNGKTYYYHQYPVSGEQTVRDEKDISKNNESNEKEKNRRWKRKYIKRKELALAKVLAQKHYYMIIRKTIEQNIKELRKLMKRYEKGKLETIYDELCMERKTLIAPLRMSVKEKVKQWKEEIYEKNIMYPENLRYKTEQGDMVRSKSEVIIANTLYQHRKDILYKYERPLKLVADGKIKTIYPDFTILNIHTGKMIYFEHAGRMDNPHYASEFVKKIHTYMANDLLPGRDLIITFETQENSLDFGIVKRLIEDLI